MDYIFPLDKKIFYNDSETWYPIMENLLAIKRIYKIENNYRKRKYRIILDEKNPELVSESSFNNAANIRKLNDWLEDLKDTKADRLKESFNSFINFISKITNISKPNEKWCLEDDNSSNSFGSNHAYISNESSCSIKSTPLEEIIKPNFVFKDNLKYYIHRVSKFMKLWFRQKPYFKREVIYNLTTNLVQTKYIDVSYELCKLTKTVPSLPDNFGGVSCIKTKDFYKNCVEYFEKKEQKIVGKYTEFDKPTIIYDSDTKLFDIDGKVIEGCIMTYQETFKRNDLFHIRSTTVLID